MTNLVVLDLSRSAIRAVEVSGAHTATPVIQRYGEIELPEEAVFDGEVVSESVVAQALKQLWKQAGFKTKNVALGLGNRKVLVREVTLPPIPADVRKETLPFQVQDIVSMSPEDTLFDFLPLRSVQQPDAEAGGTKPAEEGLLVAAARAGVTATARAVTKAGLVVTAIDLSAFSLSRLLASGSVSGTSVVVNLGSSTTVVSIVTDGVPQFVRMIPSGGDDITRALVQAQNLGFAAADALKQRLGLYSVEGDQASIEAENVIRENVSALIGNLQSTVNYFLAQHGGTVIDRVVLAGGAARLGGLQAVIQDSLGYPVECARPLDVFALAKGVDEQQLGARSLELAVALGLALGGADAKEQGDKGRRKPAHDRDSAPQAFVPASLAVHADLLPVEFVAERNDAKVLRMATIVVIGLLAIGLLASVGTAVVAKTAEASLAAEQERTVQLATEKAKYAEATDVLSDISDAQNAQAIALFAETKWLRITDEFQASLPGGMSITKLTLTEPLAPGGTAESSSSSTETDPLAVSSVITVEYEVQSGSVNGGADLIDALPNHVTGLTRATNPTSSYDESAKVYTFSGTASLDITAIGTDRAQAVDEATLQQLRDALESAAKSGATTGGN
ncbi:MAG: type IV pilus assembly protein PilM [Pseudoclavibacter sp.]